MHAGAAVGHVLAQGLTGAVGVSSAFLPQDKLVVYTEGRMKDSQVKFFATPQNYLNMQKKEADPNASLPPEIKTAALPPVPTGIPPAPRSASPRT